MIDFIHLLPVNIKSTTDWSLFIAVIGAIAFYFGKLISEVSPLKENKYVNYVQGTIFIALFVIFPPLVLYTLSQKYNFIINPYVAFILQLIIISYLGYRLNCLNMEKIKLKEYINKIVKKKTEEVSARLNLKTSKNKKSDNNAFNTVFFWKIPNYLLLVLSILIYYLTLCVILTDVKIIILFISILFTLVSISIIAIIYGWNIIGWKYPLVTIYLDNGSKLKGELTKIEEGFINIIDGNKIYHINSSKSLYIKKEILTKEGKKKLEKMIFKPLKKSKLKK